MKLVVKDLFNIPIFSRFKLIAGAGGLGNPITGTEILDFEFVQDVNIPRDHMFDGNSLVLTSLLFAKDNPDLIIDAVKDLIRLNVSCLAYKPIIIKTLPKEAIDYANAHNFPILEFGGDEYFEPLILAVNEAMDEGEDVLAVEKDLIRIIEQDMTPKEEYKMCKKVNLRFKKYIRSISIRDSVHASDEAIIALVQRMQSSKLLSAKAAVCKYYSGYFVILSQDEPDKNRFSALFEDILLAFQIDKTKICCGISSIRPTSTDFGRAIRESFWARNVALIENSPYRFYDEIGIYRLLAPEINNPHVIGYMKEYLGPILTDNDELLKTATIYVQSRGDLDRTAEALYCHKNTIRYRLSKLHALLDSKSNEKEFNENLSIAVRIYMFYQFL